MFKQFVDQVAGADQYMIASLLIFFIFFVVISLLLIKMNKTHISYMSQLPLQDDKEVCEKLTAMNITDTLHHY